MPAISAIHCPNCSDKLENDGRFAGQHVRCPSCGTEFRMPEKDNPFRSPFVVDEGEYPRVPGKLQVVQILLIVGGCSALMVAFGLIVSLIGLLWPFTYYSILLGIIAIYRGGTLLTSRKAPRGTAILQILNVLCADFVNVALGVVELVLMSDPAVEAYYVRRRSDL